MIEHYEIRIVNNEEVLYLFMNNSYEFAKIQLKEKSQNLNKIVSDFIRKNKIKFTGSTIAIVVGGLIIGNIYLNNSNKIENNLALDSEINIEKTINDEEKYSILNIEENDIEEDESIRAIVGSMNIANAKNDNSKITENNTSYSPSHINTTTNQTSSSVSNPKVEINTGNTNVESNTQKEEIKQFKEPITLFRTNGEILVLELEEYLINVVAAEMPASFSIEALKAQSILARTYTKKAISRGVALTDTVDTQAYSDESALRALWGSDYDKYYNKVKSAVESTKGQVLTYNGQYIEAVYHSTSNGTTETSYNVWGDYYPYLINIDSGFDKNVNHYKVTTYFSYSMLSRLLGYTVDSNTEFVILERNESNRVNTVSVDGNIYTGLEFRALLELRSNDYEFEIANKGVYITTYGNGHGVGMSQYGSNELAKKGYSYAGILSYYYPGTSLVNK